MNELNFKQELTGVFGQPISENPSQAMVEAAYRHHNLDWRYITMEVDADGLEAAVNGAKAMGFRGFNCTLPHKVAVIQHLDGLGESAAVMEAVNCVVRKEDGRWIGENTDGKGFLESLETVGSPAEANVIILGAGGAARAIAVELALAGARQVTIINRSAERGQALVDLIAERTPAKAVFQALDGEIVVPQDCGIFINATNIGLFPDVDSRVPVALASLRPGLIVADVIPNPLRTHLVEEAEAAGCTVLDGLGMLVNQGRIGIKYWTGIEPDTDAMRRALEEVFS
ncbi:MAG: shikimate dehydrogenase [Kiritimatiellia bacterium]|jgi:shikimate dehydrogenase